MTAIQIDAQFDSGNIEVLGIEGNTARLAIRKDHMSEFYQWFHFRVANAGGREVVLKIVGLKLIHLTEDMLNEHYAHLVSKPFFPSLKSFMMQTPVCAMVLEGLDCIDAVRKIVGATNPREADAGIGQLRELERLSGRADRRLRALWWAMHVPLARRCVAALRNGPA